MANVLNEEKKQQVLALGRLGWPLRKIQQATAHPSRNREPVSESGSDCRASARRMGTAAAKPANEVITDSGAEKPAIAGITDPNGNPKTNPENPSTKGKAKPTSKPANGVITDQVITDLNPFQRDEVSAVPRRQSLLHSAVPAPALAIHTEKPSNGTQPRPQRGSDLAGLGR